jgi:hypothetical protein
MRQYAFLTTILLLQQPSRYQKQTWCDALCDFYNLNMLEIATLLESWMDVRRLNGPYWAVQEVVLLPLWDVRTLLSAEMYNVEIVHLLSNVWMAAMFSVFHEHHLSFRQFVAVSRGLRSVEMLSGRIPNFEITLSRAPTVDTVRNEHAPTGERVLV